MFICLLIGTFNYIYNVHERFKLQRMYNNNMVWDDTHIIRIYKLWNKFFYKLNSI